MKKVLLVTILVTFAAIANAQTEQGNWLLGGGISFTSSKEKESNNKLSQFQLNPNVGVFVIPHLAVGLNADITSSTYKPAVGTSSKSTSTLLGPFVRYYIPAGQKIMILVDGTVLFGSMKDQGDDESTKLSGFRFKAGPAFFLSPSVALEATVGYGSEIQKYKTLKSTVNAVQIAAGFQIFLGKAKTSK